MILDLSKDGISVTLSGGFDADFNPGAGSTTLVGSLSIGGTGSVTFGNITIK